jgi:hypothetical protein
MYWCIALIDLTAPQPQPSADHACPLQETIRMDADQGGRVVRDDGHPRVHDGGTMAFVQEARRASIHGASRRRRKGARPAGSTQGAWDPSPSTALIPQAYLPARSVRHRVQIGSSEQAHAGVMRANATHTRVETGGRPRLRVRGQRGANERSTAATRAAHGHVSAHGPRGCGSGTKSATWRHGPRPLSPCWRDRQSGMVGSPDGGQKSASADDDPIPRTIRLGGNTLVVTT